MRELYPQKKAAVDNVETDSDQRLSERMLKNRTILLSSDVTPKSARRVMEQLLVLESENEEAPITLIINSPGGDVSSGLAIYDLIRFIKPKVRIICSGLTASIATIILCAVPKERRFSMPNTRFLLHQPHIPMEVYGPASELEITAKEILKTKEVLNKILSEGTGQPLEKLEEDTKRDFWLDAKEALDYGLIGSVIQKRSDLK